jgi:hypothetical protein
MKLAKFMTETRDPGLNGKRALSGYGVVGETRDYKRKIVTVTQKRGDGGGISSSVIHEIVTSKPVNMT